MTLMDESTNSSNIGPVWIARGTEIQPVRRVDKDYDKSLELIAFGEEQIVPHHSVLPR